MLSGAAAAFVEYSNWIFQCALVPGGHENTPVHKTIQFASKFAARLKIELGWGGGGKVRCGWAHCTASVRATSPNETKPRSVLCNNVIKYLESLGAVFNGAVVWIFQRTLWRGTFRSEVSSARWKHSICNSSWLPLGKSTFTNAGAIWECFDIVLRCRVTLLWIWLFYEGLFYAFVYCTFCKF